MTDKFRPSTSQEIFAALVEQAKRLPSGGKLVINQFDVLDLCQLTIEDLMAQGYSANAAMDAVVEMQATGKVSELGKPLDVVLIVERNSPYLIPGEGIRRTAGALADDPQTMDELFEELDEIRHPERYAT